MRLILEGVDIFVNYLISVSVNSIPCHILGDRGAVGGDVDADSWTGGWKRSWSRLVVDWSRLGCGGWPVGRMIWLRCFHPLHFFGFAICGSSVTYTKKYPSAFFTHVSRGFAYGPLRFIRVQRMKWKFVSTKDLSLYQPA